MELIPGLPNDITRECLFRLHCTQLGTLSLLSKAWKSELQSREFWSYRKQHCNKELILLKCLSNNIYSLIVVEPETNIWSELPPIPEFPNGLPETFDFVIASFRWGFVVMGAFPQDHEGNTPFCNKVFVFDYIIGKWQRGADMPEVRLSINSCTSDHDRTVYVLCEQEGYTECIMVYDVLKDEWTTPIKTRHGDICYVGNMRKMIYQSGKIHFLDDWIQAGTVEDKRVFNITTWSWELLEKDFADPYAFKMCLSEKGEWYACRFGPLLKYKDSRWQEIGQVPKENGEEFDVVTTWKSKLMVILGRWNRIEERNRFDYEGRRFEGRVFDLKNKKWTALETPEEFKGIVRAECYLEI